jgi:hypothetical protein
MGRTWSSCWLADQNIKEMGITKEKKLRRDQNTKEKDQKGKEHQE